MTCSRRSTLLGEPFVAVAPTLTAFSAHLGVAEVLVALLGIAAPRLAVADPGSRRELIIVSDMLQHSSLLSHFRGGDRFAALAQGASVYLTRLHGLRGANVTIYQIRDHYPQRLTAEHRRFWDEYFSAAEVESLSVTTL
jgi:hypothetical protein